MGVRLSCCTDAEVQQGETLSRAVRRILLSSLVFTRTVKSHVETPPRSPAACILGEFLIFFPALPFWPGWSFPVLRDSGISAQFSTRENEQQTLHIVIHILDVGLTV